MFQIYRRAFKKSFGFGVFVVWRAMISNFFPRIGRPLKKVLQQPSTFIDPKLFVDLRLIKTKV